MAGDRATNIRINIDIKNAIAKLDTISNKMRNLGQHVGGTGMKIEQNMNKATNAIKKTGDQSAASAVQFSTMANGMLNLSTSAVQTYTSISNLARAENRAKATMVSLERAEDLLSRKQLQLNKIIEAGGKGGRDYALIVGEIATAEHDLTVKTEKLTIEQEAVTDVYMLFFANIANVGVSTMMVMSNMLSNETKLKITNALVTKKAIIVNKLHALSNWNSAKSLVGTTAAVHAKTGALRISTVATKQATMATRLLNLALGPVGLIIIGISAALVAYETNFMGFKDSINGFLGIQTEFNDTTEDGTDKINEQTEAINAQATAFDKLTIPMQNYITMQEKMARQNADPRELIRLAKFRGASGFSSGVGSPSGGMGTGGFSGGSGGSGGGSFSGGSGGSRAVNNKVQQGKPAMSSGGSGDPFGTTDSKVAFYSQSYAGQRDTLLSWIDSTWDNPGIQNAYVKKYWEIYDISNGFKDVKQTAANPVDNLNSILQEGFSGMPRKSVFAGGYAGDGNIFDFKNKDNRAMIKQALGIDIGAIANTVNVHDAIKIATIQKSLGSFTGAGGRTGGLMQEIRNLGGVNSNGQTSATAMYQNISVATPQFILDAARAKDRFANSGNRRIQEMAEQMFEYTGFSRTYGRLPGNDKFRRNLAASSRTINMARLLGGSELALEQLEEAQQEYGTSNPTAFLNRAIEIADQRIDQVEGVLRGMGINVDLNNKDGTTTKSIVGKRRRRTVFKHQYATTDNFMDIIREDIGASSAINLPSLARMQAIAQSFSSNGSFSNFNNVGLTTDASQKLGLTEQNIFDIRFNSTRGDRELLNRIRYVEKIEAASSGTSPL